MSKEHYTAVIEIIHTDSSGSTTSINSRDRGIEGTKEKREVARLIIRDDSMDELINKVSAHLELLRD